MISQRQKHFNILLKLGITTGFDIAIQHNGVYEMLTAYKHCVPQELGLHADLKLPRFALSGITMVIPKPYARRIKQDKFVGLRKVMTLDEQTFHDYLNDQSLTLVLFYNPNDPASQHTKPHFAKAAKSILRDNRRTFAAVNCLEEPELCDSQHALPKTLPQMKLYARNKLLSTHSSSMDYHQIQELVESTPYFLNTGKSKE